MGCTPLFRTGPLLQSFSTFLRCVKIHVHLSHRVIFFQASLKPGCWSHPACDPGASQPRCTLPPPSLLSLSLLSACQHWADPQQGVNVSPPPATCFYLTQNRADGIRPTPILLNNITLVHQNIWCAYSKLSPNETFTLSVTTCEHTETLTWARTSLSVRILDCSWDWLWL